MRSGIKTSNRLRCLRRILRQWVDLNRRLGRRWEKDGDVPWWYNERAEVGLFAAAAWLSGGYAFEEYSSPKRGKRRRYPGRIDLEFSARQKLFIAEAKFVWLPATRAWHEIPQAEKTMRIARADISCCPADGSRKLAFVFGVPYVAKRLKKELPARINRMIEKATAFDADAVAWVFPNLRRLPVSKWGNIHPGIIVWIKAVGRRT